MPNFEYNIYEQHGSTSPLLEALIKLRMLGEEGWELVTVIGSEPMVFFFKRQRQ
jgi:hypothetical protein